MLYLDSNHNLQHSKAPDLVVNVFNSRYTTSEESVTLQPHVRYEVIRGSSLPTVSIATRLNPTPRPHQTVYIHR